MIAKIVGLALKLDFNVSRIVKRLVLIPPDISLALIVLEEAHEFDLFSLEVIFKLGHSIVIERALQVDPHLIDLFLKAIFLHGTFAQFLIVTTFESFGLVFGIDALLAFCLDSIEL